MIISVTEDDIKNGRRNQCSDCPIALALFRALGWEIGINRNYIKISQWYAKIGFVSYLLPKEASIFVCDFDSKKEVLPFEFNLDI